MSDDVMTRVEHLDFAKARALAYLPSDRRDELI